MNIKYLCYYDSSDDFNENRYYVLSAKGKIDYIVSTLNKLGYTVQLVSGSNSRNKGLYRSRTKIINEKTSLKLFATFGCSSKLTKALNRLFVNVQMFFWLVVNVTKNDIIMVYHSMGYLHMVKLLHLLRRTPIVFEVEEIYSDVTGDGKTRKRELRFFQQADAYIFPTQLLDDAVNTEHKPSVIVHGTYQVEPDRKCKFDENLLKNDGVRMIHSVYAGTLDPRKGGAAAAAAAAAFLPFNHHVHILGFGGKEEIQAMKDHVLEIAKRSKARVTYDGVLSGEEYIRFIQSCDIGLSTQNPDAAFNSTSFPSKVLSYLANGLRVVSIRIPAIEKSAVGSILTYYDNQVPEEIANAIIAASKNVVSDKVNQGPQMIENLDRDFKKQLDIMLRSI